MDLECLVKYNICSDVEIKADFSEHIGNICLGLLRIGFGKTLIVERLSQDPNIIVFKEMHRSTSSRIAAVALFILAFPLIAPFGCIHYLVMPKSKSRINIFNLYKERQSRLIAEQKENQLRLIAEQKENQLRLIAEQKENNAAITIQKYIRGHLARKPFLSNCLYHKSIVQCEKSGSSMTRAANGNTVVYLPEDLPEVVLKKSGKEKAIRRFDKMQTVRSILQIQKSSHLIIPKVRLYKDFLVEQRLPINIDIYHSMHTYLSSLSLFDEAVREFTRLFSQKYIGDLLGSNGTTFALIPNVKDEVHYDNLSLYIAEQKGKIGLIDLEDIRDRPFDREGLQALVRIFPFHLDIIKDEATKLKTIFDEVELESVAETGKKYLQVVFSDYFDSLKERGVSTDTIFPNLFEITPQRAKELTSILQEELLKLDEGSTDLVARKFWSDKRKLRHAKNIFIENRDEAAKEIAEKILPLIIRNIKTEIEKDRTQKITEKKEIIEWQLMSMNSHKIFIENLFINIFDPISNNSRCNQKLPTSCCKGEIEEQMVYVILDQLVKGGEIFYFDSFCDPRIYCLRT